MAEYKNKKEGPVKQYVTWQDMNSYMSQLVRSMQLEGFLPDVVIGPGRGGYVPGVMISHYFNIPFHGFEWQTRDGSVEDYDTLKNILSKYTDSNILVIDDINDTGKTLLGISDNIDKFRLNSDIKYATIFNKQSSSFKQTDFYAVEVLLDSDNTWIAFPYEEWWV